MNCFFTLFSVIIAGIIWGMTGRQRAFIASLVWVVRNQKYHPNHSIGVTVLPENLMLYEFKGEWGKDKLYLRDRIDIVIQGTPNTKEPWSVDVDWQGKRLGYAKLRIVIPNSSQFYGTGGDYEHFEGTYYPPSDKVEIRDYGSDKYLHAYRLTW